MKLKSGGLNVKHDCQSFKGLTVIKYATLLLLICQLSWANAAEPAPAQIDTLPDPTVSTTAKLRARFIAPIANKSESSNNDIDDIQDPTSMNENFRSALTRLDKNKAPTGKAGVIPTVAAPSLPEIKLLALACGHHKEKNHVMISINGKSEMIGMGERTTTLVNNQVVEIEVLDIQKNYVRLQLHPSNQTIILR